MPTEPSSIVTMLPPTPTDAISTPMLNKLLQLTPLTLLEVADTRALREAFIGPSAGKRFDFPYWFFQHLTSDGRLVVASPGGGRENIDAIDILNIVHAKPVRVMAMPQEAFLRRLRVPLNERNVIDPLEGFSAGSVMAAQRDRWGRFDYQVWFDDPALNVSTTYFAPILPSDRAQLLRTTTRRIMPVRNLHSASNWSCDAPALGVERAHHKKAKLFLSASLEGNRRAVARLCSLDAAPHLATGSA